MENFNEEKKSLLGLTSSDSFTFPNGKQLFRPRAAAPNLIYADMDYYSAVNVLTETMSSVVKVDRIKLNDQLTVTDLQKAIVNEIKSGRGLDITNIKPVGNQILIAGYFGDKILTLNVPTKDNKDNFEDNLKTIVLAVGSKVSEVTPGDIISYEPGAGIRLKVEDFMDRELHSKLFKSLKNDAIESIIDRGAFKINRVMLRVFFLIREHEVLAIRYDA